MDETTTAQADPPGSRTATLPARMVGRSVVGFDGSAASATALDWAVARALRTGGEVLLVGVVDDDSGAMGAGFTRHSAHEHGRILSETAARLAAAHLGLRITTRLAVGPIAASLAGVACRFDTVVVGSDKTGYARGRLYGVRSVQLAALVPGPLVVVPNLDLRLRDGVVAALDGTVASDGLARAAAEEASAVGSRVSLIHAVAQAAGGEDRLLGDEVLHLGLELAHAVDPGLEVSRHLTSRRPAEAILNLSRDRALLVVGRSRRTPAPGIGGTLHEVLINANVPVMILPGTPLTARPDTEPEEARA